MNSRKIYKAKQGGFITDAQYKSNLAKNGVKTWEEKTPEFKPPKTNLNQTGVPKINTTKVKIPNEKLEQERLRDLTGQWDLKKVKEDELDKIEKNDKNALLFFIFHTSFFAFYLLCNPKRSFCCRKI